MGSGIALPHQRPARSASGTGRRPHAPATAFSAWWSQARLDRDLAAGADPAADPSRAERARRLTTMRIRSRLARSIARVMDEAESARLGMSSEAPAQNLLVRDAAPALDTLVGALLEDGPVEPRGVALALLLLTDAAGPLYTADDSHALAHAALTAVTALHDGRLP